MICLHHLKGDPLWVNPDLIMFVESVHDTIVTLADGKNLRVAETPEEVSAAVIQYRASVVFAADLLVGDFAADADTTTTEA